MTGSHLFSPHTLCSNEDKYYVLGYYSVFGKIVTFRVDRMGIPEIPYESADQKPSGFDPVDYVINVFSMYDGRMETVELLCENNMMDSLWTDLVVRLKSRRKITVISE